MLFRILLPSLLAVTAAGQGLNEPPAAFYRGGIGTPVNDHQLLTVAHLGYDGATALKDPLTDLVLVNYAPGTFQRWATLNYDWGPGPGEAVLVANRHTQPGQLTFAEHTVIGLAASRYLVTEPTLVAGDSGGGVFDAAGQLVGINYAIDREGLSYHYRVDFREDWLRANITPPAAVPEPAIGWLLLAGLLILAARSSLTTDH